MSKPGPYCDYIDCVFNHCFNKKNGCRLNYMVRENMCPYRDEWRR